MRSKYELKAKTCCFTGHRDIPEYKVKEIETWLEKIISTLYCNNGVCFFGSGGAMGFDTIAAEVVLKMEKKYPEIKLVLVLPCQEHDAQWPQEWQERIRGVKEKAAKIVYTSDSYRKGCMHIRNRHLVNHSAFCIAYIKRNTGGTAYTVDYAEKQGVKVFRYNEF